jgi:N-methylhydantoinase B
LEGATVQIDPVRLEIVKNGLRSLCEEMAVILARTAYSTNIKTRKDFSCALFDERARILAQSFAQPSHLGSMVRLVPRVLAGHELGPGDVLLVNDPYRGAVHLNDICAISPIFLNDRRFGYVASIAHWVDVGGAAPASLALSREIYQEGLIIPPTVFQVGGRLDERLMGLVLANVRAPREVAGDLRAQLAANRAGDRKISELAERYGPGDLETYSAALLEYTERLTRAGLAGFPAGVWRGEDSLDDDGWGGGPIRIAVSIFVDSSGVTVDFDGTDPQRRSPMNATLSFTFSAVAFVLKCLLPRDIDPNDGFYRLIRIQAPEGSVVNARSPAGVVGGWEVGQRVVGAMFRAVAKALPDRVPAASKGIICNLGFGGYDDVGGRYYSYYETVAGGAGGALGCDGQDGVQADLTNTENASAEEIELNQPVRVQRYALIPDSGGPGRWRGGLGIVREYRFLRDGVIFSVMTDRARIPPWGAAGGTAGRTAEFSINGRGIPSKGQTPVNAGDIVTIETPGGGGWGDPSERDPEAVRADVRAGKVTPKDARETYALDRETV